MSTTPNSGASSVGTTATPIGTGQTTRKGLTIQNLGSTDLYVGGPNVTTATGVKVPANGSLPLGDFAGQLYGITASGTLDVRWLGLA